MRTVRERRAIKKHEERICKKEKRILAEKKPSFVQNKMNPLMVKLTDKVPIQVIAATEKAFEKGFYLVFEKGTAFIEKSYNEKKLKTEADVKRYRLSKDFSHKNIRKIDKGVKYGIFRNKGISTVEGGVLGFFGIGIPDIPVFIAMVLRTVYEICLSYGFSYETEEEKAFILYTILTGITKGEEQQNYSQEADKIGREINCKEKTNIDLATLIQDTARNLSKAMLTAKLLQGIMIVGALGGISNYKLIHDISEIASLKYKKRFLHKNQLEHNI